MTTLSALSFDSSTEQYFQLLEGLGQAVIGTSGDGTIILWSQEAEVLYGWRSEEVLGRSIVDVITTDLSKASAIQIMETLSRGRVWSGSFAVRSKAGESFEVSVTDVPLMSAGQQIAGIIGVSAPTDPLTDVATMMSDLSKACEQVWPGKVFVKVAEDVPRIITASRPHVTQLLALVISRFGEALDGGTGVEITAGAAGGSPFTDFHLTSSTDSGAYIQMCEVRERETYGILRGLLRPAESTEYAAALVYMVAGHMMLGATGIGSRSVHLLLPANGSGSSVLL